MENPLKTRKKIKQSYEKLAHEARSLHAPFFISEESVQ